MIDLDDTLRERATRWRRDEPPPPDLDRALVVTRTRRSRRPVLFAGVAAACVVAIAVTLTVLGFRATSAPATGERPTFKSGPLRGGNLSADDIARLRHVARSTADQYHDKNAITAEVVGAGVGSWLMEIHGSFECITCTGPVPRGHVLTVRITAAGSSVVSLSDDPGDLGSAGPVVSLGTVPPAPYPQAIRQLALDTARRNGDARATAAAVLTSYEKAEQASDSGTDNAPDRPAWLVQLEGSFRCTGCSHPAGATAPSGRFITLIIDDVSPYASSVFGISDRKVDLAKLGKVVTLLP